MSSIPYRKMSNDKILEDLQTSKKTFNFEKRSNQDLDQAIYSHIDTHLHSEYSIDGYLPLEKIVQRAKENSVDFISISDHNNVMAFHNLMRSEKRSDKEIIYNYDGVNILCGSEITCYMSLDNTHRIKFHLLCYGFDRSKNSKLMEIISCKYDDYKRSQYAILYYLIRKDPATYSTSLTEIKSYMQDHVDKKKFSGELSAGFAVDYFKWKGVKEQKLMDDLKDYREIYRRRDKLHLNIIDVINATHESGGLCSLAHPTISIEKFRDKKHPDINPLTLWQTVTDKLFQNGLDGVEISNKKSNYDELFNNYYRNQYLVSCGSDLHYFTDLMYKDVGKYKNDVSFANIDTVIKEHDRARRLGTLTEHQKSYANIQNQDTKITFKYKEKESNNIHRRFNYDEKQQ